MKIANALIVVVVSLALSGCTYISVIKIPPTSDAKVSTIKGQRISLPRPYIKVTPQEDGSISADIIYLPDPEHTYAIDSSSYFATDVLEVTTKDGIVTLINWTGDSSGVVSDATTSAGNVAGEVLKAEETKKATQKAKEETASKAVDDAQLEFDQAISRLQILRSANPQDPAAIQQAEIALESARLKLDAAKTALARARGIVASPIEDAANKAVVDARDNLSTAQNYLQEMLASSYSSNDILIAKGVVNVAAFRLWEAEDERDQLTGQPHGQIYGPMLFAIHEEIRESADHKTTFPFLQIVTVQQQADPKPEAGWSPSQPKYPVKWPEAPKK